MTNGGRSGNILAILLSVGLHALLLLIPWQPAQSIDLLPLEGTGVVELAVLQPVKGEADAELQQNPEPVVEPEPAQPQAKPEPVAEPVKQVAVAKPKPVQKEPTPNVTIKPVEDAPTTAPVRVSLVKISETIPDILRVSVLASVAFSLSCAFSFANVATEISITKANNKNFNVFI